MSTLILALFGLACVVFAVPFGESALTFQGRICGVSPKLKPIFIWSYRLGGVAMIMLAIYEFSKSNLGR